MLDTAVISISVFGYWKVSFYPPNTDTDSFYGTDTDIESEFVNRGLKSSGRVFLVSLQLWNF